MHLFIIMAHTCQTFDTIIFCFSFALARYSTYLMNDAFCFELQPTVKACMWLINMTRLFF